MQADQYIKAIRAGLSSSRLDAFQRAGDKDRYDHLARYLWNAQLCQALYPALQWVEVLLRNRLYEAVAAKYPPGHSTPVHVPCWLDFKLPLLAKNEVEKVSKAKARMAADGHDMTPGQLVAHLDINFWVKLLHSPYNEESQIAAGAFWPGLIPAVFPEVERKYRNSAQLKTVFEDIRLLRNRAFHHEPILGNAVAQHDMVIRAISWLDSTAVDLVKEFDQFDAVYALQPRYFRERLDRMQKPEFAELAAATAVAAVVEHAADFDEALSEAGLNAAGDTVAAVAAAEEEGLKAGPSRWLFRCALNSLRSEPCSEVKALPEYVGLVRALEESIDRLLA